MKRETSRLSRRESRQSRENKMGTMPMVPLLFSMAVPPMLSMFMQYTYNAVDCMFVSWLSEKALTAVSLAFPVTTLILSISIGLGVGANALIARALGAGDQDRANSLVTHSLILSGLVSLAVTAGAFFAAKPFYGFFTDDPEIYRLGLDYLCIVAFMAPGNMVHIALQKAIQATGNMVAPMLFQMAGVVLNFILDPILIFGYFGFPALGVKGAAIATVAGYLLSTVLAFWVIIFTKQKVRIKTRGFRIEAAVFRDIFVVGLPSLIMNALGAFMVVFANLFLRVYSATAIAFFGVYFKIQQLIVMTVNGLIQGCIPVMSFCFGAKNRERLMEALKWGTVIAVIMMGVGAAVLWLFPGTLLGFFNASPEMKTFGIGAMRIMSLSYVFAAFGFLFASFFQSTGNVPHSLAINFLRQLVFLVPLMGILSRFLGMAGVWWAFPLAEAGTALVCWILFFKKRAGILAGSAPASPPVPAETP